jgi:hypothetical protein
MREEEKKREVEERGRVYHGTQAAPIPNKKMPGEEIFSGRFASIVRHSHITIP